ncbi:CinA family protein [Kitasatospora sp. DSM 101779]|uniref:CinA family protein n=1 Tax=Kitasatospora sp. DSM 101779 TaxID=2853165 RepID=UPI0037EF6E90|nr:CinA family protein [Kitasatospora sp. DSM 101779]
MGPGPQLAPDPARRRAAGLTAVPREDPGRARSPLPRSLPDRPDRLARQITAAPDAAGRTLAAESLTAGALCQVLAEAPGAAGVLRGGVVAYGVSSKAIGQP